MPGNCRDLEQFLHFKSYSRHSDYPGLEATDGHETTAVILYPDGSLESLAVLLKNFSTKARPPEILI